MAHHNTDSAGLLDQIRKKIVSSPSPTPKHKFIIGTRIMIILAVIFTVLVIFFHRQGTLSGFITASSESTYTDTLSLEIINTTLYPWTVSHQGGLTSIKISGSMVPETVARVYLVADGSQYLVYQTPSAEQSQNIQSITGLATVSTASDEQNESLGNATNSSTELPEAQSIQTILMYHDNSPYDSDNDGVESLDGVIDVTVNESIFAGEPDPSQLCTRWEIYSVEQSTATTACFGADACCNLLGIVPAWPLWNEPLYLTYNLYGATQHTIVSAQVIYFNDSAESQEMITGTWHNVSATFIDDTPASSDTPDTPLEFTDVCSQTCALSGLTALNDSNYSLLVEVDSGKMILENIRYTIHTVTQTNEPPALRANISDIVLVQGGVAEINLNNYFFDTDVLRYTFFENENLIITFDRADSSLAFIAAKDNFTGVQYIFFTAHDAEFMATSNVFKVTVLPFEESIRQHAAEINKPVKWEKKIRADGRPEISVPLLPDGFNISLAKMEDGRQVPIAKANIKIREAGLLKDISEYESEKSMGLLAKELAHEQGKKKKDHAKISALEQEIGSLGLADKKPKKQDAALQSAAIQEPEVSDASPELSNSTAPELIINDTFSKTSELSVSFFTEPPLSTEEEVDEFTKFVTISSDYHYGEVKAYTAIDEVPSSAIKLYWIKNGVRELFTNVTYNDTNSNGLVDYIEWIVPHLSNQTFEVSITVLDLHSYPPLYGNWTVRFNTTGTGNLTISPINGTSYAEFGIDNLGTTQDLEMIELRCDDTMLFNKYDSVYTEQVVIKLANGTEISPAEIASDSVPIQGLMVTDYNCAGLGYWTVKELTTGSHYQQFNFSGFLATAENFVNESGNLTFIQNRQSVTAYLVNGTANATFYNVTIKALMLNDSFAAGYFDSQVFDAGKIVQWKNISWISNAIGELTNNKQTEEYFADWGVNMSKNVLLMHLNNDSSIGENDTLVFDFSGDGHNGTCDLVNSKCPSLVSGRFGKSKNFDGTNDVIQIPISGTLNITTANITVSAWFNGGAQTTFRYILDTGGVSGTKGWSLYTGSNGGTPDIRFIVAVGGIGRVSPFGGNIWDSTWHHVVGTYNGSDIAIYVDGAPVGTPTNFDSGTIDAGTDFFELGGNGAPYVGRIDEVAVWNATLTPQEILNLYRRGINRLNLSVRSCDDAACAGEPFLDPNYSVDWAPQNLTVAKNRYFQYNFTFETENLLYSPELYNVTIQYDTYSKSLCNFGDDLTECNITSVKGILNNSELQYNILRIKSGGVLQNITNEVRFRINASQIIIENGGALHGNANITAGNVTVVAGGLINATRIGYTAGTSNGAGGGPGGGAASGFGGGGGGHGGDGGLGLTSTAGKQYETGLFPIDFGSGGGGSSRFTGSGGDGGGSIIINATDTLIINGTIIVNGGNGTQDTQDGTGGGGGGSVLLLTSTFTGNGTINATGGSGGAYVGGTNGGGGGGGGRVAIYYSTNTFTGKINVSGGGAGNLAHTGFDGSLVFFYGGNYRNLTGYYGNLTIDTIRNYDTIIVNGTNTTVHLVNNRTTELNINLIDGNINVLNNGNLTLAAGTIFSAGLGESNIMNNGLLSVQNTFTIPLKMRLIDNGTLTIPTNMLIVNGTVEIRDNLLNETSIVITSSGLITVPDSGSSKNYSLNISAVNLTIERGGNISANAKGYRGGSSNSAGQGPGGGSIISFGGGGAGYGGVGGEGYLGSTGGVAYGSITRPFDFGSGGGGSSRFTGSGGHGGGLIFINVTDTIIINGSILSLGQNGTQDSQDGTGGGAGGSIFVIGQTITGNGTINASGGTGGGGIGGVNGGGGGAGGRIALHYATNTFTGIMNGTGGISGNLADPGGNSTVYLHLFPTHNTAYTIPNQTTQNSVVVIQANVTGTILVWVNFTVTAPNGSAVINNTNATSNFGDLWNSSSFTADKIGTWTYSIFAVDNLSYGTSSSGSFTVPEGICDSGTYATVCNISSPKNISGKFNFTVLNILSGGVLQNQTNNVSIAINASSVTIFSGGIIRASVNITATNITIESGGLINASSLGYIGGAQGDGNPGSGKNATGPGAGLRYNTGDTSGGGGGGYGGTGGAGNGGAATAPGGDVYGSSDFPVNYGSGGSGGDCLSSGVGGSGGGLIFLNATNRLNISGLITADGENKTSACGSGGNGGGGGSGGAILLFARNISGNGELTSRGGSNGATLNRPGGGGGGRIAMYYGSYHYIGMLSVTGGASTNSGATGTLSNGTRVALRTANNSVERNGNITFFFNATDPSGIDTCILYGDFNGSWLSNQSKTGISSGVESSFNINLTNGTFAWNVLCNNSYGYAVFNRGNYTISVDGIEPGITLNTPVDGFNSSGTVRFNWTAIDNLGFNMSCNLTIAGVVNVSGILSLNGTPANVTVTNFNEGTYNWNVTCLDNVTNVNTSLTQTFTIDKTAPVVTLKATKAVWQRTGNVTTLLNDTDVGDWIGTSQIEALAYDSSDDLLYLGGASGKFGVYNRTSNVTSDLSETDNPTEWIGSFFIRALIYDSSRKLTYLGGNGGRFGYYNHSTNSSSDLMATDNGNWLGTEVIYSLAQDTTHGLIYIGGNNGLFGVYNLSSNKTLDLRTADAGDWVSTNRINKMVYNSANGLIYFAGNSGIFGSYNSSSNSTIDLRSTDIGDWITTEGIFSMVYDSDTSLIYLGLNNGLFGVYNYSTNSSINLASTDSGNWIATNAVYSLEYDSGSKSVYLGTNSGFLGVYNISTNTTSDLSATDGAMIGTLSDITTLTFDSLRGIVYLGGGDGTGTSGVFGFYNGSIQTGGFTNTWGANATNDTWQRDGNITLGFSARDSLGIDTCVLYGTFDGVWSANQTKTSIVSDTLQNFSINLTNGTYRWNIYCNDTVGNAAFNSTNFTFNIDYIVPGINLNAPVDGYNTSSANVFFNWTALDTTDRGLTCNLTINGSVNVSNVESLNGTGTNVTVAGFNEGTFGWNVTCIDNATNSNTSLTRVFTRDTTPPVVSLDRINNTWHNEANITLLYTATDGRGISACTLYGDFNSTAFIANQTKTQILSGVQQEIRINLTNGTYHWNVYCNDTVGNSAFNGSNFTFFIDSIIPGVTLHAPANGYITTQTSALLNWTAVDNLDTGLGCNLTINSVINQSRIESLNGTPTNITVIGFNDGVYLWNVTCEDNASNVNTSEMRKFSIDTTQPAVNLNAPVNNYNTSGLSVLFNWTGIDNLGNNLTCNLTMDGVLNRTGLFSINGSPTNVSVINFNEGSHSWNLTCTDNATNVNTSLTQTFTVDRTPPVVSLNRANDTWQQDGNITLGFTATDSMLNISQCSLYGTFNGDFSLNRTNISIVNGLASYFTLNASNGTYLWNIYCNDTVGNAAFNGSNYTFNIDFIVPGIDLNAPVDGYNTTSANVLFNWTALDTTDKGLTCNLSINRTVNVSNVESLNGSGTNVTVAGFNEGTFGWNVTCIDNATNSNTSLTRVFTRDTTPPVVSLDTLNTTLQQDANMTLKYTATDGRGISACTLYGNFNGTPFIANQTKFQISSGVQQEMRINVSNGTYLWNVYCNDTVGNAAFNGSNFTFFIDSIIPGVTLHNPANRSQVPRNVLFNWTAVDNFDTGLACNLTINSVVNRSNIESLNGTSTNVTVTNFDDGSYLWNVTCIDNASNVNTSATFNFTIDVTPPVIALNGPHYNATQKDGAVALHYTATDISSLDVCTAYGDFSGAWQANVTNTTVTSGVETKVILRLANGTYRWNVYCNDTIGNAAFNGTNFTFFIDGHAPQVTINSPPSGYVTAKNNFTFNWTAIDNYDSNLSCNLTINNTVNMSDVGSLNNSYTNVTVTGFNAGVYRWNVTCSDNANTTNISISFNFERDILAPVILLNVTPTSAEFGYDNVTVNWTVTETHLNSTYVNVSYPNSSLLAQYPTNVTLTPSELTAVGVYTIIAWANDSSGNVNTSSISLSVGDTISPSSFNPVSPTDGTKTANQTPTLDWEDVVEVNFDNYTLELSSSNTFGFINRTYKTNVSVTNSSFIITDPLTANINWSWRIIAHDRSGNLRYSTQAFRYEIYINTPPTTPTLAAPSNNTQILYNQANFSWSNVSDIDSDALTYELLIAKNSGFTAIDLNISSISAAYYDLASNFKNLSHGRRYWKVRAYDGANYSNYSAVYEIVSVVAIANITAPEENLKVYAGNVTEVAVLELNGTDWIQNMTIEFNSTNYTAANAQNSWSINLSFSSLVSGYKNITAYAFNLSDNLTARTTRTVLFSKATSSPGIDYICSNETYALNNSNITIKLKARLDAVVNRSNVTLTDPSNITYELNIVLLRSLENDANIIYQYNATYLINQTGTYTLNASVRDIEGRSANTSSTFAAVTSVKTVNLSGTNIQNISLNDVCSNEPASKASTHLLTIPDNSLFNVEIKTEKPTVTFSNANLTNTSVVLNYTDVAKNISAPSGQRIITEFEIKSGLGQFDNITVTYNYSALESGFDNEQNLKMYKCTSPTSCDWTLLTTTLNTTHNTITAVVNSLSVFLVSETATTTKTITETVTSTSTNTLAGGGGSYIESTTFAKMDIIVPSPLKMYLNDTLRIPLAILNTGQVNLSNITLGYQTTSPNLEVSLPQQHIDYLEVDQQVVVPLIIRSFTNLPDTAEIMLTAKSSNPFTNATARIVIERLDRLFENRTEIIEQKKYITSLFKNNPECIELTEMLDAAEVAAEQGEFEKARSLLDAAINACRELLMLQVRPPALEQPKKISRINLLPIILIILGLIMMIFVIAYMSRKHTARRHGHGHGAAHKKTAVHKKEQHLTGSTAQELKKMLRRKV